MVENRFAQTQKSMLKSPPFPLVKSPEVWRYPYLEQKLSSRRDAWPMVNTKPSNSVCTPPRPSCPSRHLFGSTGRTSGRPLQPTLARSSAAGRPAFRWRGEAWETWRCVSTPLAFEGKGRGEFWRQNGRCLLLCQGGMLLVLVVVVAVPVCYVVETASASVGGGMPI